MIQMTYVLFGLSNIIQMIDYMKLGAIY